MNSRALLGAYLAKATGAGSRGGQVLGVTRSGKPIYKRTDAAHTSLVERYSGFTAKDHRDAEDAHRKASQNQNVSGLKAYEKHSFHEELHRHMASSRERGEKAPKEFHARMASHHKTENENYSEAMGRARSSGDWSSHSANKLNGQAAALLAAHHQKMASGK